jgi:predicted MPP superfamily phosphohydrolase
MSGIATSQQPGDNETGYKNRTASIDAWSVALVQPEISLPSTLARLNSMNLGLIADIHADIRALEAALGRLDDLAIGRIYCAGDLVGYGSEPDAVAALLRDRGIPCISGNHDRWALERRQVLSVRGWKPAQFHDDTWDTLQQLTTSRRVQLSESAALTIPGSSPPPAHGRQDRAPSPTNTIRHRLMKRPSK